jgi:hypothetical protein
MQRRQLPKRTNDFFGGLIPDIMYDDLEKFKRTA